MNESILITGANIGLGKETARQLALKKETKKVILFCRNQAKAAAAQKDLEEKTGKKLFEIIIGDVTDANSVRKAVEEIKEPIDAIVLNAGGVVGKTAANNPLLTRQVLSSTATIRLGGGRAAPRRQIKLTLTAAIEPPIPQGVNEGGGDSGAGWHL